MLKPPPLKPCMVSTREFLFTVFVQIERPAFLSQTPPNKKENKKKNKKKKKETLSSLLPG